MTFVRIKTIQNKRYKYLVKNIRIKKKTIQKVIRYIGPVKPIYNNENKTNKPKLFVRKLSDQEIEVLNKKKNSPVAFTKDRARIILASNRNCSCKQISKRLGFETRKIRTAVKTFNAKGLQCLVRGKAKGAPPKFTEATKKVILMHFSKQPKDFGLHFTTWTLPRFRKHLIDYKVVDSISIERLRQILDAAGARLKRSKRWQYSPDPEFDKKNLK